MNLHHAATHITSSYEQHHEADTRLYGRRMLLARIVWFALVAFTLSVYMASLPEYVTKLQTVCRLAACSYGQLSPETVVALEHVGLSVGSYTAFMLALAIFVAFVFFGTGGLIYWHKSDDWMALLFALGLVVSGTYPILWTVGTSHSAWQLPVVCVAELLWISGFLAFILFPDGRFVPRWTRWLFVVYSIESAVVLFFTNTFHVFSTTPLWLEVPLVVLFVSLYVGLLIAQIYRYRYVSTLVQRQQTKWVVYGLSANVVWFAAGFLPTLIFPRSLFTLVFPLVLYGTLFLYPFTMSIAILRYRLWDIDVLINRTLVYGSLTALLVGLYVGLILSLQALVGAVTGNLSQQQPLVIVVSTLVIAALFQPLRRRLQNIIDRRFYRRKYDAARVIASFSATLRQEVDLDQLREHLLAVVQETMQPTYISLWLRPPESARKHQMPWSSSALFPEGGKQD